MNQFHLISSQQDIMTFLDDINLFPESPNSFGRSQIFFRSFPEFGDVDSIPMPIFRRYNPLFIFDVFRAFQFSNVVLKESISPTLSELLFLTKTFRPKIINTNFKCRKAAQTISYENGSSINDVTYFGGRGDKGFVTTILNCLC